MPNEKEIKEIMAKARKAASGGKIPPQKEVKEKPDSGGTKDKSLAASLEKEKPQPKPSPEIAELKSLIVQQNQNVMQQVANQNDRIGAIENFLKEAQRQAQAQAQAQMGNQGGQDADQPVGEKGLTDEQRLAKAQEEQDRKNKAGGGQMPMPKNVPPALAYLYAFNPTFKEIAETVRVAIAKGKVEKEGSEISLESLGKDMVITAIKKTLLGQAGGGDNTLNQLKAFSDMQNIFLGGFFNTLKYMGKEGAQAMMSNIFRETASPTPSLGPLPPSEDHII